jgi:hypothetical protein
MRPSKDKYYRVDTLELHCFIASLLKGFQQEFTTQDLHNLHLLCKTFASMIPKIIRWLKVDFSQLCGPGIIMSNKRELTLIASKWQVRP